MNIKNIAVRLISLLFYEVLVLLFGLIGFLGMSTLFSFLINYIVNVYDLHFQFPFTLLPLILGFVVGFPVFSYLTFHWLLTGKLKQIFLIFSWKSPIAGKKDNSKEDFKTAYIKRGKQS